MSIEYTQARAAWVEVDRTEVLIYDRREGDEDLDDYDAEAPDLADIVLTFRKVGTKRAMSLNLSRLRADELEALSELFALAIAKARPITTQLDTRAQQAFEEGNDADPRLYRPVPRLHRRARAELGHGEGVPG